MPNPYLNQPTERFWRKGVVGQNWAAIEGLYKKKFDIPANMRIMTAGSCFAQHIGRRLKDSGYRVMDAEPAPAGLNGTEAQRFGYQTYTARYGNIYTARQLLQLYLETRGRFTEIDDVWRKGDRYVDSRRPNVEPEGLPSPEEVRAHRARHIQSVRKAFTRAELFIFTFGLTEAWRHRESGTIYPVVPGTSAGGEFSENEYVFHNFDYSEVLADFLRFRTLIKRRNPDLKFIVTVSPVPLVATAADRHVLQSTMYSKSVLRAVAGYLADRYDDIDYFPSYELIMSPFSRQCFYDDATLRDVRSDAVEMVMSTFLREHGVHRLLPRQKKARAQGDDVVCEEMLLEAFAQ